MTDHSTDSAGRRSGASDCSAIDVLLSGYLDGELTQQQAQRVRLHIETCERCRQLQSELLGLKEQMQQLSYPKSDEEMLAVIEQDLIARGSAWLGWSIAILGLVIVAGALLASIFLTPDLPVTIRILYGLFMLGGLGLFVSVLRQRLLIYKNDKYRKVKL